MHGIKRTRITPQAAEAKRLKEQSKIETYIALQSDVLGRKKAREYTQEALGQTTRLLDLNPEFYTIWNYRRNILLHGLFPESSSEEVVGTLKNELKLTMAYLQIHPKVYWIWNHRKWCLEHVPLGPATESGVPSQPNETEDKLEACSTEGQEKKEEMTEGWRCGFWKGELAVIEALLDADSRNFHAWDYRRYVLSSLPSSFQPPRTPAQELSYTRKKIESNFSNFSAWHCRTKILGGMWEGLDPKQVDEEKDQVTQALWTDPGDQSGWIYHKWLIGTNPPDKVLRREISNIRELHDTEPDAKWCMNALANYLILQSNLPSTDKFKATRQREEARSLFGRLEEIDPDRKERYKDIASAC